MQCQGSVDKDQKRHDAGLGFERDWSAWMWVDATTNGIMKAGSVSGVDSPEQVIKAAGRRHRKSSVKITTKHA